MAVSLLPPASASCATVTPAPGLIIGQREGRVRMLSRQNGLAYNNSLRARSDGTLVQAFTRAQTRWRGGSRLTAIAVRVEADATIPADYVLRALPGTGIEAGTRAKIGVYLRSIQGTHGRLAAVS